MEYAHKHIQLELEDHMVEVSQDHGSAKGCTVTLMSPDGGIVDSAKAEDTTALVKILERMLILMELQ